MKIVRFGYYITFDFSTIYKVFKILNEKLLQVLRCSYKSNFNKYY
jgi:hypothetical protein